MMVSNQRLEWHFCEAEDADYPEWSSPVNENPPDSHRSTQDEPARTWPSAYVYELILGIAIIYGMGVYLIWQQTERRMTLLEVEVATLRSEQIPPASAAVKEAVEQRATSIETDYLRFDPSLHTVDLVTSIALHNDAKYQQLYRDFEVTLPIEKVTIVVDTTAEHLQSDENTLFVPSPRIAAPRFGISEADALTNEIMMGISKFLFVKALKNREIKPQWRLMTLALQSYLQLDNGHDPYWQLQPAYLFHRRLAQTRSIDLVYPLNKAEWAQSGLFADPDRVAREIADPLIEFMIETYGYAQVPLLLDAFEQHLAWETLTPAVFNLSAEQFEEQWHRYLSEHYPITDH